MESNLWRDVTHLWYGGWPVQGVPSDPGTMLAFLSEARSHMKSNNGPNVVHCSPGTGRTGTVIACDICIREFEVSRTVDVPKTVYAIRRCRAGAVQTRDQYALIYKVRNRGATFRASRKIRGLIREPGVHVGQVIGRVNYYNAIIMFNRVSLSMLRTMLFFIG